MSTQIKRRRGTTVEHASFTGAVGELTVDLTKDTAVIHDGVTQGGFPLLREDLTHSGLVDGTAVLDLSSLTVGGAITVSGNIQFATKIISDNSVLGILGEGTILDNDATGGSFFEVDNMRIRKNFRTHLFVKDQVRATNGLIYVSDVSEVAQEKAFLSTDIGVTLDIQAGTGFATFAVGDELLVKNISPDGSSTDTIEFSVTAVDTTDPDFTRLTVDVINSTSGTVYEGDTIVRTSDGTILLDAQTEGAPFMAIGVDAKGLGLSSASDTGTYLNGSGHMRIGTTDASGNLSKGFKFDGTNALLEAGNASIGINSGFFGASDILAYSLDSVTLSGFMASSTRLSKTGNSDLYIGESLSTVNAEKTMLVGFWRDQANAEPLPIVRIRASDTGGGANIVQMKYDGDSLWGMEGFLDGTQVFGLGSNNFIGGTFFDANDLWLGSATKANATVLLDGENGQIVTDSIGTIVISPSSVAAFTSNAEAPSITDEFFLETISRSANGSDSTSSTKRRSTFIKRFGADIILVHGVARQGGVDGGGAAIVERTSKIIATFTNRNPDATDSPVTGSTEISSTTDVQFSFQIDVSSLTNNDIIEVEIKAESSINISSYDSGTYTTETHLREDVDAQTSS